MKQDYLPLDLIESIIEKCDQKIEEIKDLEYREQANELLETINMVRKILLQAMYHKQ